MRSSWWSSREAQKGYHRIDDDKGEIIDDIDVGRDPWAARDVPIGLGTALDIDQVAIYARAATTHKEEVFMKGETPLSKSVQEQTMQTDVSHKTSGLNIITHHEAGPYLCGFIYYESLAQCYTRNKRADVLFCHVPAMLGEDEVIKGRDAVVAVVEGAVRWLIEQQEDREEQAVAVAVQDQQRGIERTEQGQSENGVQDVL